MQGRTPTKAEKQWMNDIVQIGCICCIEEGSLTPYEMPPEYTAIHHIDGKTKPEAHLKTIPICPFHHQEGPDARHVNKKRFVEKFGTEEYLLKRTGEILNEYRSKVSI